jgi:glycerophosphoryl diester phosphodiesterase
MSQTTLAFAHRGWHFNHIENTMGALNAAYAAGCDGVEFDVQLTSDGIPVLFHDDDLRRLAGRPEQICDMPWKELREIRLVEPGKQAVIPSLAEFLEAHGTKPFYLELKIPEVRKRVKSYWERLATLCLEGVRSANPHGNYLRGRKSLGIGFARPTNAASTFSLAAQSGSRYLAKAQAAKNGIARRRAYLAVGLAY